MDKYTEGVDEAVLARALRAMEARGIGVQVNLFAGFPGDALEDAEGSVEFLVRDLATLRNASFFLSAFTLLPGSPVASSPVRYGVKEVTLRGDIAQACAYSLEPSVRESTEGVMAALPRFYRRLEAELGWGRMAEPPVAAMLKILYSGSAQGCLFKSRPDNPFALPLETARALAAAA